MLATAAAWAAPADEIAPRTMSVPGRTAWRPLGCRSVPFSHPVLLPRTAFHRAHGDLESDNEVALAYAPVFERAWLAEPSLYQVTTPAFDGAGNIYMTPLLPHEPILLISLEPHGRRAALRGAARARRPRRRRGTDGAARSGFGDRGGVRQRLRPRGRGADRRHDGVGRADRARRRRRPATRGRSASSWVPNADAIVALTRDGFVVLLDRRTGAPLLPAPFQLPGERTPPRPSAVPPSLAATVNTLLAAAGRVPAGIRRPRPDQRAAGRQQRGGEQPVGRRAPTAASGSPPARATARTAHVDGVSELGAVYRYDVVPAGGGWTLAEVCHRNFPGGSASTPTLGAERDARLSRRRCRRADRDRHGRLQPGLGGAARLADLRLDRGLVRRTRALRGVGGRHLPGVRRRRQRAARLDRRARPLRRAARPEQLRRHEPAAHRRRRERPADPGGRRHPHRHTGAAGTHRHRPRRSPDRRSRGGSRTASRNRSAR